MAFKNPFKGFTIGKLILFVIGLVLATQIISLLISLIFKDIPVLRTGPLFIIVSGSLAFFFLAKVVIKGQFEKLDVFGFVILVAITVALYIYGGQFIPQIFSLAGDSALQSAQALQSALGLP